MFAWLMAQVICLILFCGIFSGGLIISCGPMSSQWMSGDLCTSYW